jgi:hypothetical protein
MPVCPLFRAAIVATLLMLAVTGMSGATIHEAWVQRYNNIVNSMDSASKVVFDSHGDMVVTGSSSAGIFGGDFLTIKYFGADGRIL